MVKFGIINNEHIDLGFKSEMEWSNLNEQMINGFFQDSNSPTNAEISLNFTRTSRQMGSNQKPNKQISPRLQIVHQQNHVNPQSDIFAFADKEIQKFDSWSKNIQSNKQKYAQGIDLQLQSIENEFVKYFNPHKTSRTSKSLENDILSKVEELSRKMNHIEQKCQHCQIKEKKLSELQTYLKRIEISLQQKSLELSRINQIQIKQLGQELSFEVQNRLLHDKVNELKEKNIQLSESIQAKNLQLTKLSEEINRFHFQKSNFLSKTKSLETRLHQMQKSKSLLMSAAKNSTSHSEFNITTNNNTTTAMLKSQQAHIDSTLIHTNNFSADKPTAEEYCQWFDRLKQIFLQKYKKQEKEYIKKFPELKNNEVALKEMINNFKKGHARYEVARSWNNIANYVYKNKQNFLELIGHQINLNIKIPNEGFNTNNKQTAKIIQDLEQQLKKSQKKAEGHLSQIQNLNQQLMNLKKTLLKQKQQKTHLSREVDQLQEQLEQVQQELGNTRHQLHQVNQRPNNESSCVSLVHQLQQNLSELERELVQKTEELKQVIYESRSQQQTQLKLSQSVKQCQRLLYKERVQKIRYFKQTLPQQCLTTACRIRAKSINEKKLTTILHEFEGRVYLQKERMSYKFDIVQQTGKKSRDEIFACSKKILVNCIYQPTNSLLLSMGSADSEFREYFRSENGLLWSSITQVFRLKLSEKRFLQIDVALSIIQVTSSQFVDLMDNDTRKKVSLKKEGQKIILQNCLKISFQTEQQAKSALNTAFSRKHEQNSHLIAIFQFSITDKRNKQKYVSKLYFTQVGLHHTIGESSLGQENFIKDSKAIWNVFNRINFRQEYQPESNRLTCLLSQCLNQNSKNLIVINVSPIEYHKQNSLASLNYGSNLKQLTAEKPQSLIRYTQKTPEHSVSKMQHNSSHSLMQTPTLNRDLMQEKPRSITRHRNSSSEHMLSGGQNIEKKKRTISRLSIC